MKTISFIIPSYNVERYLNTALESFITDNEALNREIEVIVVDDGSSDGTAGIAKAFIERHPEMFRLIQKENGGHGSTINIGSLEAKGKYFKVIDADDWIVTENLADFLSFLRNNEVDAILTPFHMVDMTTREKTLQKMYAPDYDRFYTPKEIAADWKSFDRCTTFHGITYRTDFYNQYRHELPEKVFYEDQEYATIPFCHAANVAVLDLIIYQYLVGNSQQSIARGNQLKRIGHLKTVIESMLNYLQKHAEKSDFSQPYFLNKLEDSILAYYKIMCVVNPDKHIGRKNCEQLNSIIEQTNSGLSRRLRKKYRIFHLFALLHVNEFYYEKIIHSVLFRLIRGNRKIEKE